MKKIVIILLHFNFFFAQVEPENIEFSENEVEDNFYEAMKQKGIENYDKAIVALEKCLSKDNKNAELYFQLGSNYYALKKYTEAEENYNKALIIQPNQRWYLNGLYDVYYETRNFTKSEEVLKKLIPFDPNMKEDLVSVYMMSQKFQEAKTLIDEIENTGSLTKKMESYRSQLVSIFKPSNQGESDLQKAIKQNPNVEQNYIDLIVFYAGNDKAEKAFEIAKKLAEVIPNSEFANISLLKYHINANDGVKATESFKTVLNSSKIDNKIKHRVLNEYLNFALKNETYLPEIEKNIAYISDPEIDEYKELGKYFYKKDRFDWAEKYFEKSNQIKSDDLETIDLLLNVYDFNKNYEKMAKKGSEYVDLYPAKPNFYYYAGKGCNNTKLFKKAKDFLEMGLDYIVDDKKLEQNFYKQLVFSADGLGDAKLKEKYSKKIPK